jgi:hypothetical protein
VRTRGTRRALFILGVPLGLALTPACAVMVPPIKNSGPSVSQDGIRVAVVAQQCTQIREPDFPDYDLVEEIVDVQAQNVAATPITIRPDAFRLVAPDGAALRTITWEAAKPLAVGGGATRTFRIRFMNRGSLQCAREMELAPRSGVTLGSRPVRLNAVRFVPSRSER